MGITRSFWPRIRVEAAWHVGCIPVLLPEMGHQFASTGGMAGPSTAALARCASAFAQDDEFVVMA